VSVGGAKFQNLYLAIQSRMVSPVCSSTCPCREDMCILVAHVPAGLLCQPQRTPNVAIVVPAGPCSLDSDAAARCSFWRGSRHGTAAG
jgi:hypothetical protein